MPERNFLFPSNISIVAHEHRSLFFSFEFINTHHSSFPYLVFFLLNNASMIVFVIYKLLITFAEEEHCFCFKTWSPVREHICYRMVLGSQFQVIHEG